MNRRRVTAFLLALILAVGIAMLPAGAAGGTFADVADDAYYHDAVLWALEQGVTAGTSETTFSPADTCTRGQVVTFLWRAQGQPEPSDGQSLFADVAPSDYFCKPVLWAVESGITNGTSDTAFSPGATCTRAQVLTFLWRAVHKPAANGDSRLAAGYAGTYFENAVAWADTNGMLSGMGRAFAAEESCPRSDIVTYLYRFSTGETVSTPAHARLTPTSPTAFRASDVPAYAGAAFVRMNGNRPYFSADDLTTESYELYGALDSLGRCTVCVACVGTDLMPTEERGSIGQVRPTGWHTVKYDCVDGKYLYNRAHLIGYQLTGENANVQNLITGTRYFNLNMLDYENLIAEYVEDYNAHVLYRVTPVFNGTDLLASGVLLEGTSVEDQGKSVQFCVFLYNVQPGIVLDYATGDSREADDPDADAQPDTPDAQAGTLYILNTNTHKFHYPDCASVKRISAKNKQEYRGDRAGLLAMGYDPCGNCHP